MSKKLIFIGPPGAGKTTLKKIFFQGENSNKLLEYALEPTYGEESLIFRLSELNKELGIFDLAGQENDRWFSEDKAIFQDAKIILVILDISDGFEEIVDFIRKVIKLRNNTSSTSKVIVFIHKIDLATPFLIQKIKSTLKKYFKSLS
ncbi:MAG: ADP-ribosylation factor-like protein [Candidatus Lokiarchaeota archaeon]